MPRVPVHANAPHGKSRRSARSVVLRGSAPGSGRRRRRFEVRAVRRVRPRQRARAHERTSIAGVRAESQAGRAARRSTHPWSPVTRTPRHGRSGATRPGRSGGADPRAPWRRHWPVTARPTRLDELRPRAPARRWVPKAIARSISTSARDLRLARRRVWPSRRRCCSSVPCDVFAARPAASTRPRSPSLHRGSGARPRLPTDPRSRAPGSASPRARCRPSSSTSFTDDAAGAASRTSSVGCRTTSTGGHRVLPVDSLHDEFGRARRHPRSGPTLRRRARGQGRRSSSITLRIFAGHPPQLSIHVPDACPGRAARVPRLLRPRRPAHRRRCCAACRPRRLERPAASSPSRAVLPASLAHRPDFASSRCRPARRSPTAAASAHPVPSGHRHLHRRRGRHR